MPRSGKAALRVVSEFEPPPGDETLTQERMDAWSEGQLRCRTRGRHYWKRFHTIVHGRDPNRIGTRFDVIEQCPDCRNRRSADHIRTVRGIRRITDWKSDYREVNGVPYLLPKGAQRITDDVREELVAKDFLNPDGTLKSGHGKLIYVDDDE